MLFPKYQRRLFSKIYSTIGATFCNQSAGLGESTSISGVRRRTCSLIYFGAHLHVTSILQVHPQDATLQNLHCPAGSGAYRVEGLLLARLQLLEDGIPGQAAATRGALHLQLVPAVRTLGNYT